MITRNETRKIFVGDVQIGGQDKVVIQSMTHCQVLTSMLLTNL